MLQLLLEGESWIWGGVKPGFEFKIGIVPSLSSSISSSSFWTTSSKQETKSSIIMRTLSLSPKVLQVVNLLDQEFIDQVMDSGKSKMMRSPEVLALTLSFFFVFFFVLFI